MAYLVVSEESYGGYEGHDARLFRTLENAQSYKKTIEEQFNLDVEIRSITLPDKNLCILQNIIMCQLQLDNIETKGTIHLTHWAPGQSGQSTINNFWTDLSKTLPMLLEHYHKTYDSQYQRFVELYCHL